MALCLLAAAFVAWPLLRGPGAPGAAAEAANVAVYRDQKAEIEADHAKGLIGDAERATALAELTQRLAEDLEPAASAPAPAKGDRRPWLALGLALALPFLAGAIYWRLGAAPAALQSDARAGRVPTQAEMVGLVDRLAERMAATPDDLSGWLLLARSQGALGRYTEAAAAYARADALSPKDPEILANWANAEAMAADGELAGKPYALAQQALALDPRQVPALALAAAHELKSGALKAAREHLSALLAELPPEADEIARVKTLIAEIDAAQPAPVKSQ